MEGSFKLNMPLRLSKMESKMIILYSLISLRTIVGVVCKDGIVLGTEKLMVSKMLVEGSHRRIFNVHDNIGIVSIPRFF